ncbi:MAG TPA: hypothetical protein VG795_12175 [Acidimicrobiia bacterium]|nr:hypothetical protein [Acidimicrobiia bacterium]
MKKLILTALIGTVALAPAAHAQTTHCPDHNSPEVTKVEGNNNDFVPPAGAQFCVKASTENTGVLTADGTRSLIAYVEAAGIVNDNDQPHDVSYYVLYGPQEQPAQDEQENDETSSEPPVSADDKARDDDTKGDDDQKGDDDEQRPSDADGSDDQVDVNVGTASDGPAAGGTADNLTAVAGSDVAVDSAGETTAPGTVAAAAEAGPAPDGAQTQVLGETLERGPGTLARTGAGVGGLALLGGALCGAGRLTALARRLLGIG